MSATSGKGAATAAQQHGSQQGRKAFRVALQQRHNGVENGGQPVFQKLVP
jgi:hypothetical protein